MRTRNLFPSLFKSDFPPPAPRLLHLSFSGRVSLSILVSLLFSTTLWALPPADIPSELGSVVYRIRSDAPTQLYIVVNSHRSAVTGANGSDTVQAQVETFRIGEWLIDNERIGLVLPESYFGYLPPSPHSLQCSTPFDQTKLLQRLTDTTTHVNAEFLLHEQYGIGLLQIEDADLYHRIRELLLSSRNGVAWLDPEFAPRLTYLQKCRSAAILQRVPSALKQLPQPEGVPTSGALLTIGLAHLDDILTYLDTGVTDIPSSHPLMTEFPVLRSPLKLQTAPIGISIIIPRSLLGSLSQTQSDRS